MLPVNNLLGILGAAFLFGFAVLVHELGHFLMAKWLGVGVKKFAIGFGPKIVSFTRGGTEYSIRWIPLGGFVALKGMIEGLGDEEEEKKTTPGAPQPSESAQAAARKLKESPVTEAVGRTFIPTEDLDALRNKPPLARIAVFASGVICNYLTAIVFTGFWLWYGVPTMIELPNIVEEVPTSSTLHQMGWRSGDRIVGAYGKKIANWDDVETAITDQVEKVLGKTPNPKARAAATSITVTLDVARADGTTRTLPYRLGLPDADRERFAPPVPTKIAAVTPNSAADRARLVRDNYKMGEIIQPTPTWDQMQPSPIHSGDVILAVNDQPVKTWHEMEKILQANPDKAMSVTVQRGKGGDQRLMKLAVVLERSDEDQSKGRLGVMADFSEDGKRDRKPFLTAFAEAPSKTVQFTYAIIRLQVDFIAKSSWRETQRNMGGPIAIAIMTYKSVQKGLSDYLQIFIMISVILAFMNVLPIPVLDGGYIAITIVESIIRRPVPQKVLAPILTIFMFLFILLFVFLFYNDIRNYILKF